MKKALFTYLRQRLLTKIVVVIFISFVVVIVNATLQNRLRVERDIIEDCLLVADRKSARH